MIENPGYCQTGGKRHCGNIRGHLWECGCPELNRKTLPAVRTQFENDVIWSIVNSQKVVNARNTGQPFKFNLAMFCSGGLLGEEILLFRLFNELRRLNVSGTICLFLIDWEYKDAISKGTSGGNVNESIDQFLREICGCLQPSIKVEGTFFGDAEEYIRKAQGNAQFKQDLLIGADPEGAEQLMGEINQHTSSSFEQAPIVLVKKEGGPPAVCRINPLGEKEECYQPFSPEQQQERQVQRPNQPFPWELVAAGGGVAVLGILALFASSKTRH